MVKPTDESSDLSPKKKNQANTTQATIDTTEHAHDFNPTEIAPTVSLETLDADETVEIMPEEAISSEFASTEQMASSWQDGDATEFISASDDDIISTDGSEFLSTDDQGQTPTSAESFEFLTAEGQNPATIAMELQSGGAGADLLDGDNLLQQVAGVFVLWWHWAYFEISVTSPNLPRYNPPKLLHPEAISSSEHEFVYDIYDSGYKLNTSKGSEMYSVGMSMCKMFYTIEKMIFILIQRLKDEGIGTEEEVQVSFDGHLLAQRKAFESIINLNYNVVVTNFDPGIWGERYLEIVKRLSDRGYGYPSEAPREIYKITKRNARSNKP